MEIGIAFPKIIPVGRSDRIVEWAEHADDGPFSSLALIDRLVAELVSRGRLHPVVSRNSNRWFHAASR